MDESRRPPRQPNFSTWPRRATLGPGGRFATTDLGPWGQNPLLAIWSAVRGSRRVILPLPLVETGCVEFLKTHMEAGQYRAVVDREYPFEAIAEAYRYGETEQKTGIVVINV